DTAGSNDAADADLELFTRLRRFLQRSVAVAVRDRARRGVGGRRSSALVRAEGIAGDPAARTARGAARARLHRRALARTDAGNRRPLRRSTRAGGTTRRPAS